jgi:hypothetical protein
MIISRRDYDDVEFPLTLEEKKQWVEALRSGRYQQAKGCLELPLSDGQGNLTGTLGNCCLGVLRRECGLVGQVNASRAFLANYSLFNQKQDPPTAFRYKLPQRAQQELALKNDGGDTFEMIADYIEARIPAIDEFPPE